MAGRHPQAIIVTDAQRASLVRRVIKQGNSTSVDDLNTKVLTFIGYFNRTLAKPFTWTYRGCPLVV